MGEFDMVEIIFTEEELAIVRKNGFSFVFNGDVEEFEEEEEEEEEEEIENFEIEDFELEPF